MYLAAFARHNAEMKAGSIAFANFTNFRRRGFGLRWNYFWRSGVIPISCRVRHLKKKFFNHWSYKKSFSKAWYTDPVWNPGYSNVTLSDNSVSQIFLHFFWRELSDQNVRPGSPISTRKLHPFFANKVSQSSTRTQNSSE